MGKGSDCGPCRVSGSAGGGAGETQGCGGGCGGGSDNGEESLEDKKDKKKRALICYLQSVIRGLIVQETFF